MINTLIFDYGGVISDGGRSFEPMLRLANNLKIDEESAIELIKKPWGRLSSGIVDVNGFWVEIDKAYGSAIPSQTKEIWNTYENCMKPRTDVLHFLKTLRSSGYHLGLLSNTVPPTANSIRNAGGYKSFDFTILSCEVGLQKPESRIYELILENLPGMSPADMIYVDDVPANLDPARALGIKTVLANSPSNMIGEIASILNVH